MRRLARPASRMKPHYTVVVVGSGYGGGIMASRLARAGQDVCVLERGREWLPGEFPDTELEALGQMQGSTCGKPLDPTKSRASLYHFHIDEDINVFRGCGLGGTSLVNANVVLEAEPAVWADPRWPAAVRADWGTRVKEGYARAREMLSPAEYPDGSPRLAKMDAQKRAAEHLQANFCKLPIAVSFQERTNAAGVEQKACTLCGDCVSGCNVSAKNTVAMTYLPDAANHGAEIFTEIDVQFVQRNGQGWLVHFRPTDDARANFPNAPLQTLSADVVVLAGGALGSTEILLRSKARGLPLSDRVGQGFSGNGDVVAFGYNGDYRANSVGLGTREPRADQPVGPCITSAVDIREQSVLADGMIIEEGTIPGAVSQLLSTALSTTAKTCGKDTDSGIIDCVREVTRELESLVRGPYYGAVNNTMVYLVMTHDDAKGFMYLDENEQLRIAWPGIADQEAFRKVNDKVYGAVEANGGTLVPNPIWSNYVKKQLITVHPLGGCCMAESAAQGVTNHQGQVFSQRAGSEVYPGLYVADGSVIPMPVGVNPLLTISALAERSARFLAEERGWSIDYSPWTAPLPAEPAERIGIRFTESMKGWFSRSGRDFEEAARLGKEQGSPMRFVLTVNTSDLAATIDGAEHVMELSGTLEAPNLSRSALWASGGSFQLLPEDPGRVETKNMIYRMNLDSVEGERFHFYGEKLVHDDRRLDLWKDTTTLYVTIRRGHDPQGEIVGRAILEISPDDFARQLTTIQVTGTADPGERLKAVARFGGFFAGSLYDTYGGIFSGASVFDPKAPPRKRRKLVTSMPEVHPFVTSDGVTLRLTRYPGGKKGPVILSHGLGVSSRIFSTDTIDTNLVEYLFMHGYDVWLLDYRVSIDLPASRARSTGDTVAQIDYPEAVARVLALTGAPSVQMLVHCYGATTFFMAMLGGLSGVRSAVVSQIAAHVKAPPLTVLKSGLHVPEVLSKLGFESLTAYTDREADLPDKLFDLALSLSPQEREERCNSPVCHRVSFLYSLLYEHDQLNTLTHGTLHELFGLANIAALSHLAEIVRAGHLVDAKGQNRYLDQVGRLGIPMCFIHGAENHCYAPRSTELTFDWLKQHHPHQAYTRHVVPNYGHIDCIFGKNAVRDVYPLVLSHLEKTALPA